MQAMSERENAMRAAQLSYKDALIHVEIVQASDLQKASAGPTGDWGSADHKSANAPSCRLS